MESGPLNAIPQFQILEIHKVFLRLRNLDLHPKSTLAIRKSAFARLTGDYPQIFCELHKTGNSSELPVFVLVIGFSLC